MRRGLRTGLRAHLMSAQRGLFHCGTTYAPGSIEILLRWKTLFTESAPNHHRDDRSDYVLSESIQVYVTPSVMTITRGSACEPALSFRAHGSTRNLRHVHSLQHQLARVMTFIASVMTDPAASQPDVQPASTHHIIKTRYVLEDSTRHLCPVV